MKPGSIRPQGAYFLAIAAVITLSGCVKERPSRIVKMLQNAGATDVHLASVPSIQQWLSKHREIAANTEAMCKQVRSNAPVEWSSTTEGRVCSASAQVVFFNFTPRQEDHKTYGAGWK